jgi:hypothetical protein
MMTVFLAQVEWKRLAIAGRAIAGAATASRQYERAALEHAHVFGSFTLGTLSLVVLDGLAFVEAFVRRAFDRRRVEEDVSPLALDEAEALVSQFLDRSLRHANSPARHSSKETRMRTVQLR